MQRRAAITLFLACALLSACASDDDDTPTSTTPSPTTTQSSTPTTTLAPSSTTIPTTNNTPTPIADTPTASAPKLEPTGFPLNSQTPLGVVTGPVGSRTLTFDGTGPTAYDYAFNNQPDHNDLDAANRSGWNCETHYEYESIPAVDFYIPTGTPLIATMDGTATLYAISHLNDFDRYSVSREPYLGNPDRSSAGYTPFPGPSSGLGVYIHIENTGYITEYGHLDLGLTVNAIPASSFIDGYSPSSDYATLFQDVPQPRVPTAIAQWQVRAGDIIGMSGDAGYSEGPHLHYTIQPTGEPLRCPTNEPGYTNAGWLFR